MKLFIDANILVSVLNREFPLFNFSARILSLADTNRYTLYTSPLCLGIAFYFAEKKCGSKKAKEKIALLMQKIALAEADHDAIKKALNNEAVLDFEDGMEYYAAIREGCECIITQDVGDFHFSNIPVSKAEDFLMNMKAP